jgi:hypothetical protein
MKKIYTIISFLIAVSLNAQNNEEKVRELFEVNGLEKVFENVINESIKKHKKDNPWGTEEYWLKLKKEVLIYGINNLVLITTPKFYNVYSDKELSQLIEIYKRDKEKLLTNKQNQLTKELETVIFNWSINLDNKIEETVNAGIISKFNPKSINLKKSEFKVVPFYKLEITNKEELELDKEHNPGSYIINFGDVTGKQNVRKYIEFKNVSNQVIEIKKPIHLDDKFEMKMEKTSLKPNETVKIYLIYNSDFFSGTQYSSVTIPTNTNSNILFGIKLEATDLRKMNIDFDQNTLKIKPFKTDFSKPIIFHFTNTGDIPVKVMSVDIDNEISLINHSKGYIKPNGKGQIFIVFSSELMKKKKKGNLSAEIKVKFKKDNGFDFGNNPDKTIKLKIME